MEALLHADIERALVEKRLLVRKEPSTANDLKLRYVALVHAGANSFYGVYNVTDWQQALSALAEELKRTGLFAYAEIGWFCQNELIWRRRQPQNDPSPFVPKLLESSKHIDNPALRQTLALIVSLLPQP